MLGVHHASLVFCAASLVCNHAAPGWLRVLVPQTLNSCAANAFGSGRLESWRTAAAGVGPGAGEIIGKHVGPVAQGRCWTMPAASRLKLSINTTRNVIATAHSSPMVSG